VSKKPDGGLQAIREIVYIRSQLAGWGTPDVTGEGWEHLPLQTTDWESVRNDSNQLSRDPQIL